MDRVICEVAGNGGQIQLTATSIRIRRKGLAALFAHGLKGDKEILIRDLSAIQFRDANLLTSGYIQFAFRGGSEAHGGILQATSDENTVMFSRSKQRDFEQFRDAVRRKMTPPAVSNSPKRSSLDELEQLAALLKQGVVTAQEFEAKKKQLLAL
jgi:hypothetical protein